MQEDLHRSTNSSEPTLKPQGLCHCAYMPWCCQVTTRAHDARVLHTIIVSRWRFSMETALPTPTQDSLPSL